jgi:hydrogenase maturation protease
LTAPAPLLVFGWGNPSRGDDALGPLFVERLQAALGESPQVEFLTDFQLQVEHALDLAGRARVLLVDASVDAAPPFEARDLRPSRDATSLSSHAVSPVALLQAFVELHRRDPPPTTLLAIRAESFDLGEPLGAAAQAHLDEAIGWAKRWIEGAGPAVTRDREPWPGGASTA